MALLMRPICHKLCVSRYRGAVWRNRFSSVGSSFEIGVEKEVVLVKLHKKIREPEKKVGGSSA